MKIDRYQACWIFAEELRPLLSDSDLAYARANWDRTVRQQVLHKLMLEQSALHELLEAKPDDGHVKAPGRFPQGVCVRNSL